MKIIGNVYEHDAVDRWLNVRVKNLKELETALQEYPKEDKLVFWMGVQNLTGEVFPVKDIGHLCHKYNAFYICDATALLGHVAIEPNIDDWCDFLALDGHKAGTELGIGCCWISDRFDKWLDGFKLHGTPNLAGALAMTQAAEDTCDKRSLFERIWHYADLANCLSDELVENNIEFNVVPEYPENDEPPFTYAINAIRLPGFNADALQQYLASKQVYISIGGSACAEKHDYRVLNAYGLSNDEASEVIRISFGENSSVEDIVALVEGIVAFRKEYL